jgi:hypothetical protein
MKSEDLKDFLKSIKFSIETLNTRSKKIKLNENEIFKILLKYEKNIIFEKSEGKFNIFSIIYDKEDRVIKRHKELKDCSYKIQYLIKVTIKFIFFI